MTASLLTLLSACYSAYQRLRKTPSSSPALQTKTSDQNQMPCNMGAQKKKRNATRVGSPGYLFCLGLSSLKQLLAWVVWFGAWRIPPIDKYKLINMNEWRIPKKKPKNIIMKRGLKCSIFPCSLSMPKSQNLLGPNIKTLNQLFPHLLASVHFSIPGLQTKPSRSWLLPSRPAAPCSLGCLGG